MLTQGCCLVIIGSWSETNQRKQVPQLQEPDVKGYDPHLERTLQVSLCLLCCALLAGCNSIQTPYTVPNRRTRLLLDNPRVVGLSIVHFEASCVGNVTMISM